MAKKNFKSDGNGGWIFEKTSVIVTLVFMIMSFTANALLTAWLFPLNSKININTVCIKEREKVDHDHDLAIQRINNRVEKALDQNKKQDDERKELKQVLRQQSGGNIVF